MTEARSLELAASVWCDPTSRNKVMDGDLAAVFARILREEVRRAEQAAFEKGRGSVYRPGGVNDF